MTRTIGMAAIAGVAALFLCGTASAQDKEKAKVCEKLSEFQQTVDEAAEIRAPDRGEGSEADLRELRKDYNEYARAAEKYAKPQVKNLEQSIDALEKTVKKMPNDATLAEARAEIQDDVRQVRMAHDQLEAKLECAVGGAGQQGQEP